MVNMLQLLQLNNLSLFLEFQLDSLGLIWRMPLQGWVAWWREAQVKAGQMINCDNLTRSGPRLDWVTRIVNCINKSCSWPSDMQWPSWADTGQLIRHFFQLKFSSSYFKASLDFSKPPSRMIFFYYPERVFCFLSAWDCRVQWRGECDTAGIKDCSPWSLLSWHSL